MSPRRLYRSRRDRQLAGVAGGIADYLDIDPTVIRILWILSIFVGGFGILLYIIMAFIVPLEPAARPAPWAGPAGPAGPAPGSPTGAPAGVPTGEAGGSPDSGTGSPGEPSTDAGSGPSEASAAWVAPAGGPAWASNPSAQAPGSGWQPPADRRRGRGGLVVGVLLVAVGGIALAGSLAPGWIAWPALGPVLLVGLGVALLVGATRRTAAAA